METLDPDKLFTYGCSHGLFDHDGKGHFDRGGTLDASTNSSFYWIGKHLNMKLFNRSSVGASNQRIFNKVIKDFNKFTINNIVIVQWSYMDRKTYDTATVVNSANEQGNIISPFDNNKVANIYYKHIYNETDEANMILIYSLFLEYSFPSKFYFSFVDGETVIQNSAESSLLKHFNNKCKNITVTKKSLPLEFVDIDEKKYVLPCRHLNAEGNKLLSNLYLNKMGMDL